MYIKNTGIEPIDTTSRNATKKFRKNKKITSIFNLLFNKEKTFFIIYFILN